MATWVGTSQVQEFYVLPHDRLHRTYTPMITKMMSSTATLTYTSGRLTRSGCATAPGRPTRLGHPARAVPVPLETVLTLAEVGDVEAPTGAIFIAAAIATVAVLLVPFGLKVDI